jgi:hypothetical protein
MHDPVVFCRVSYLRRDRGSLRLRRYTRHYVEHVLEWWSEHVSASWTVHSGVLMNRGEAFLVSCGGEVKDRSRRRGSHVAKSRDMPSHLIKHSI